MLLGANAFTLWWLVRHYRTVGNTPLLVRDADVWIRHGTLVSVIVPYQRITGVKAATWQAQPPAATKRYLKLSGGDDPSVLLQCEPPLDVSLALGIRRSVALFGLRPDDPRGFVEAVAARVPPRA